MSENFIAITWSHILFVVYVTLLSATQDCTASNGMMMWTGKDMEGKGCGIPFGSPGMWCCVTG